MGDVKNFTLLPLSTTKKKIERPFPTVRILPLMTRSGLELDHKLGGGGKKTPFK